MELKWKMMSLRWNQNNFIKLYKIKLFIVVIFLYVIDSLCSFSYSEALEVFTESQIKHIYCSAWSQSKSNAKGLV